MADLLKYKDLVYEIIGSAMSVHSELGYGLLEPVYQEALHLELLDRGIENVREQEIRIFYKTHEKTYKMDIVVGDIIVELKSVSELISAHRSQLCNYLRLTKRPLGILINFEEESLVSERWAYNENTNNCYIVDRNMHRLPTTHNLLLNEQLTNY